MTIKNTPKDALNVNRMSESIFSRFDINTADTKAIVNLTQNRGLDAYFIVDILNYFDDFQEISLDSFNQYPITTLVDYLERSHQYYREKKLPEIEQSIFLLIKSHGSNNLFLNVLKTFFKDYKYELSKHFVMEEELLFPYSRILDETIKNRENSPLSMFSLEYNLVKNFIDQHEESHEKLSRVRDAIFNFTPSEMESSNHRILVNQLNNFEKDLHFHSLIEDKILVPKLLQVESQLKIGLN